MTILQTWTAIRTVLRVASANIVASLKEMPNAIRNVRQARHHRSSVLVVRDIHSRYPFYYAINAEFPPLDLTNYPKYLNDDVPFIRVNATDLNAAFADRPLDRIAFAVEGIIAVRGECAQPMSTAPATIEAIERKGWHILTVNDARRIVEWRDLKTVENAANYAAIAETLYPFCEGVIAARTAIMVAYMPGFPRPFKLWRISLKGVMPTLPPVG